MEYVYKPHAKHTTLFTFTSHLSPYKVVGPKRVVATSSNNDMV